MLGVDDFKASEVTLRFRIKTLPLKQWEVGRELRRRIKKAFDARGIRIPAPQMHVTMKRDVNAYGSTYVCHSLATALPFARSPRRRVSQ